MRRDITGLRFGKLVAIEPCGKRRRETLWLARCDCGSTKEALVSKLTSGKVTHCGCVKPSREKQAMRATVHGYFGTPTYASYRAMIQRCTNKRSPGYPGYGGRGITVCDRWLGSFKNFLADMGERPKGKTLDRKDGALGYSPDNCRWATYKEQVLNRTCAVFLTLQGKTQCLSDWLRELDVSPSVYYERTKAGMSPVDALLYSKRAYAELLLACEASGQMTAQEVSAHVEAREMPSQAHANQEKKNG